MLHHAIACMCIWWHNPRRPYNHPVYSKDHFIVYPWLYNIVNIAPQIMVHEIYLFLLHHLHYPKIYEAFLITFKSASMISILIVFSTSHTQGLFSNVTYSTFINLWNICPPFASMWNMDSCIPLILSKNMPSDYWSSIVNNMVKFSPLGFLVFLVVLFYHIS